MKKNVVMVLAALLTGLCFVCCQGSRVETEFVTVGDDGRFYIGDSVYCFSGTNFWYGAILASEGCGGDRVRLSRELDLMQAHGVDNVRVLVGAEGETVVRSHIQPVLQTAPGVYNDTILDGLDYLMAELERRQMKAVLYLTNAWEWSGGYGTYLEWAGLGRTPDPNFDGWNEYCGRVCQFVRNDSAKAMLDRHIDFVVSRTNRYTGRPYSESPALMAWEIANEPRAFARDKETLEAFEEWVLATARRIKGLDPNHLVATGSEGLVGTELDIDLWARIHNAPEIDYAIIHLWPYNWGWVEREDSAAVETGVEKALELSADYIRRHAELTKKPLVLEEFGYPRDRKETGLGTAVSARDRFYAGVFRMALGEGLVQGCNIWGWGGYAEPAHEYWQPWDAYTCDPAHEPQGLYSVFASDTTTLGVVRAAYEEYILHRVLHP